MNPSWRHFLKANRIPGSIDPYNPQIPSVRFIVWNIGFYQLDVLQLRTGYGIDIYGSPKAVEGRCL